MFNTPVSVLQVLWRFSSVKLNTAIKISMGRLQGPTFYKEVKFHLLGVYPTLLGSRKAVIMIYWVCKLSILHSNTLGSLMSYYPMCKLKLTSSNKFIKVECLVNTQVWDLWSIWKIIIILYGERWNNVLPKIWEQKCSQS